LALPADANSAHFLPAVGDTANFWQTQNGPELLQIFLQRDLTWLARWLVSTLALGGFDQILM
jgi:hypothetical protein